MLMLKYIEALTEVTWVEKREIKSDDQFESGTAKGMIVVSSAEWTSVCLKSVSNGSEHKL